MSTPETRTIIMKAVKSEKGISGCSRCTLTRNKETDCDYFIQGVVKFGLPACYKGYYYQSVIKEI